MKAKRTVRCRDLILGEGLPKICIPLVAEDDEALKAALAAARQADFDLVEFRGDLYQDHSPAGQEHALRRIRDILPGAVILYTVRTREEGGAFDEGREAYIALLKTIGAGKMADLVDVELRTPGKDTPALVDALHERGVKVVGSWHDFKKTPPTEEMVDILRRMQDAGMDVTKLAVMPESRGDVCRLLEAAVEMDERWGDRPCITMAMGEAGRISRILGSFTGCALTFATAGAASAPGQMSSAQVKQQLYSLQKLFKEK